MTLNAMIAFIMRFFTDFDSSTGQLRHSGWRQTYNLCKILSPTSSLPLLVYLPTLQRGLSAIAELLVTFMSHSVRTDKCTILNSEHVTVEST